MARTYKRLTVEERAVIEVRVRDGWSFRRIAEELGRSPDTISSEVGGAGGRAGYTAGRGSFLADFLGRTRRRRRKLEPGGPAFAKMAELLRRKWSPEPISGRRLRIEGEEIMESGLDVSHETIYAVLYALPRGELRRELLADLRRGKPQRGRRPKDSERRGKLVGMTNISERPPEVEGRLVPGHWEGDLIVGANGSSAIGTLVERTTGFLVLAKMPSKKADVAACAFAGALNAVPQPLRKTLTYDQGKELARHAELAEATGMRIFFADPHSPWQRGTNENTNGLLRQYFPKGTALSGFSQAELDAVADEINGRPRKRLAYATPKETFLRLVAGLPVGVDGVNEDGVRLAS